MQPGIRISLSQRPVLAPELRESVRLLQHSASDLHRYIQDQLESNPLIDRQAPEEGQAECLDSWSDADVPWGTPSEPRGSSELPVEETEDLRTHLARQAGAELRKDTDRRIASLLIERIDDNGYVQFEEDSVAEEAGATVSEVQSVLRRLQALDPPGVFARSLTECLALQLREQERLDPPMERLLEHLDLVEKGEAVLADVLGVDREAVRTMLEEIQTLDPRPGLSIGGHVAPVVVPDVIAHDVDGAWQVELNPAAFPRVYADQAGFRSLRAQLRSERDADYMATRWREATWLIRALRQRARTVFRVADVLVRIQGEFLRKGVGERKPLTLADVARRLDLHESTVSRVVSNKHLATSRAIIPFREFLDRRIRGTEGVDRGRGAVCERIRCLIEEEAESILSDQQLVARLEHEGIAIARRTVAKYRKALGIPSSTRRRTGRR